MEEEKVTPPAKPDPHSGKEGVKLTLQPMHDEKKEGTVSLSQDESTRMEELSLSDEQKAKEAEALAKVLLLEKESQREKEYPGLMIPWKLSITVLLIILFFVILHFAFSLFAPKGGLLKRMGDSPESKVEHIRK